MATRTKITPGRGVSANATGGTLADATVYNFHFTSASNPTDGVFPCLLTNLTGRNLYVKINSGRLGADDVSVSTTDFDFLIPTGESWDVSFDQSLRVWKVSIYGTGGTYSTSTVVCRGWR